MKISLSILIPLLILISILVQANGFPKFSEYPALESSSKRVGEIGIDTDDMHWKIKDRLESRAKGQSANFSGKYFLLQFGCGTECSSFKLIDVDTGAIIDSNIQPSSWGGYCFQINSNLLIVDPITETGKKEFIELHEGTLPDHYRTIAYSWNGKKFNKISESSKIYDESC